MTNNSWDIERTQTRKYVNTMKPGVGRRQGKKHRREWKPSAWHGMARRGQAEARTCPETGQHDARQIPVHISRIPRYIYQRSSSSSGLLHVPSARQKASITRNSWTPALSKATWRFNIELPEPPCVPISHERECYLPWSGVRIKREAGRVRRRPLAMVGFLSLAYICVCIQGCRSVSIAIIRREPKRDGSLGGLRFTNCSRNRKKAPPGDWIAPQAQTNKLSR